MKHSFPPLKARGRLDRILSPADNIISITNNHCDEAEVVKPLATSSTGSPSHTQVSPPPSPRKPTTQTAVLQLELRSRFHRNHDFDDKENVPTSLSLPASSPIHEALNEMSISPPHTPESPISPLFPKAKRARGEIEKDLQPKLVDSPQRQRQPQRQPQSPPPPTPTTLAHKSEIASIAASLQSAMTELKIAKEELAAKALLYPPLEINTERSNNSRFQRGADTSPPPLSPLVLAKSFISAVTSNQTTTTKMLLDSSSCGEIDVNKPDLRSGEIPIFLSIRNSNLDMIQLLLANGSHLPPSEQILPIAFKSTSPESLDVVHFLLERTSAAFDFDRVYVDCGQGESLLIMAVKSGVLLKVKKLVELGADADLKIIGSDPLLVIASENGQNDIVEFLLALPKMKKEF